MIMKETQTSLVDLTYLKATCGGSEEMVQAILKMFLDTTPGLMQELHANAQASDWDQLTRNAHKAKSSFLTIGAKSTGEKLQRIETGGATNDTANLVELVDDVLAESELVLQELREL